MGQPGESPSQSSNLLAFQAPRQYALVFCLAGQGWPMLDDRLKPSQWRQYMEQLKVDIETVLNWLAMFSVCQGLMAEDLADIAGKMEVRTFSEKERLADAGDEVTEFWILVDGFIESFYVDLHGQERFFGKFLGKIRFTNL
jgi:hypothetical protein